MFWWSVIVHFGYSCSASNQSPHAVQWAGRKYFTVRRSQVWHTSWKLVELRHVSRLMYTTFDLYFVKTLTISWLISCGTRFCYVYFIFHFVDVVSELNMLECLMRTVFGAQSFHTLRIVSSVNRNKTGIDFNSRPSIYKFQVSFILINVVISLWFGHAGCGSNGLGHWDLSKGMWTWVRNARSLKRQ